VLPGQTQGPNAIPVQASGVVLSITNYGPFSGAGSSAVSPTGATSGVNGAEWTTASGYGMANVHVAIGSSLSVTVGQFGSTAHITVEVAGFYL
jgi:hypothetical protein